MNVKTLLTRALRLPFPYGAPRTPDGLEPVPRRRRYGADYDTDWSRRLPARVTRAALRGAVMRPVVSGLADPQRRGLDRLARWQDAGQPMIFAANHHSHLDTPVLLTSIPRPWQDRLFVGAAADYFFRNPATSAASALAIGAIPIERTRVSRASAQQAADLLDDGWSMLIFPEGGRSKDGWGQPFRAGAAYLAQRCDVPVVPIHVEGTKNILRKGKTLPQPATATVTFGEPLLIREGEDSRKMAVRIEQAVAALADEAGTDWYSARRRAHAGRSPALTGPDARGWRRAWALGDSNRKRRRERRTWPRL